ncbi:hypothetical protein D3C75_369570 [compost metagenome]
MDTKSEWTNDESERWIKLGHLFGKTVFDQIKQYASDRFDANASNESKEAAEKAILDTIYGFMMLFDGVMETAELDHDHSVEFALMGRVYNIQTGQRLEEIELAPEGDGLCMGFHMWADGEFE